MFLQRALSMVSRIKYYFACNFPEQNKIIELAFELEKELFYFANKEADQHRLQADKSGLDTAPEVIPSK